MTIPILYMNGNFRFALLIKNILMNFQCFSLHYFPRKSFVGKKSSQGLDGPELMRRVSTRIFIFRIFKNWKFKFSPQKVFFFGGKILPYLGFIIVEGKSVRMVKKKEIISDLKHGGGWKWKSQQESLRKSTFNPGEHYRRKGKLVLFHFELQRGLILKHHLIPLFLKKKWE